MANENVYSHEWNIIPNDILHGGTSASTVTAARTNLGVYSTTEVDTEFSKLTSGATVVKQSNYSTRIGGYQSEDNEVGSDIQPVYIDSDGVVTTINHTIQSDVPVNAFDLATSSTNGIMSATDKAKLDTVEANANNYVLPTASSLAIGGIKVGYETDETSNISKYPVQLDSNDKAYVQVPYYNTAGYIKLDESATQDIFYNMVREVAYLHRNLYNLDGSTTYYTDPELTTLATLESDNGSVETATDTGTVVTNKNGINVHLYTSEIKLDDISVVGNYDGYAIVAIHITESALTLYGPEGANVDAITINRHSIEPLEGVVALQFIKDDINIVPIHFTHEAGLASHASYLGTGVNVTANSTQLSVDGNLVVTGNIIQGGTTYETQAETVLVKSNLIVTRNNAVAGMTNNECTGIHAKLYDGTHDGELVFRNDGIARVGTVGDLQPLATREETPTSNALTVWDSTNNRFQTRPTTLVTVDANGVTTLLVDSVNSDNYTRVKSTGIEMSNGSQTLAAIPSQLSITNGTATTTITPTGVSSTEITATSSRSYKTDIKPCTVSAIDKINELNIVDFYYKSDETKSKPKVGFIAEDTDPLFSTPKQNKMDITNCIGLLLKAVQELSHELASR